MKRVIYPAGQLSVLAQRRCIHSRGLTIRDLVDDDVDTAVSRDTNLCRRSRISSGSIDLGARSRLASRTHTYLAVESTEVDANDGHDEQGD